MAKKKQSGKGGRKHNRGSRNDVRNRYWNSKRLEKRKVRNLVRCNGMNPVLARQYWLKVRTKRIRQ